MLLKKKILEILMFWVLIIKFKTLLYQRCIVTKLFKTKEEKKYKNKEEGCIISIHYWLSALYLKVESYIFGRWNADKTYVQYIFS